MAKLKKAPGRIIGRWKAEAIAGNGGASDEDLARMINDRARKEGYDYTITPEKVRAKGKKKTRKRARRPAAAAASAARTTPAPAPKAAHAGRMSMDDVRAVQALVDRIGAAEVQELARMVSRHS